MRSRTWLGISAREVPPLPAKLDGRVSRASRRGAEVREMADWLEYLTYAGDSSLARERAANGRAEPWRVRFWGVGNESWGCGGHMSAARYAEEFRRYGCFLQLHGDAPPLCRVACGADGRSDDRSSAARQPRRLRRRREGDKCSHGESPRHLAGCGP